MSMIQIEFVEPSGTERSVRGRVGWSLMETAVRNGVEGIVAQCGGACGCATCHVVVDPAWAETIGGPNEMEDLLLDLVERAPTSRLSCQVRLRAAFDGLRVTVADQQV